MVALLRQADNLGGIILNPLWRTEGYGELCWLNTVTDEETASSLRGEILSIIHAHNQNQPDARRMAYDELDAFVRNGLHRWRHFSDRHGTELLFHEPTLNKPPESPVVLGSEAHRLRGLDEVFPNAPNSMRDVESTLNFKSREDHFPTWGG
jgi:hypothetical protein